MTDAVLVSRSRVGLRTACVVGTGVPAPIATATPAGDGVIQLFDGLDPVLAGHAGVPEKVKLFPGASGGGASYNLRVYGLWQVGVTTPLWLPIPLYLAAVVADLNMGAPVSAEVLAATDRLASACVQDSHYPTTHAVTVAPGTAEGPAVVELHSRGCPYLLVMASDAKGFVLLGGL